MPGPHNNAYLPGYVWDETPYVENSYPRETRLTSELLRVSLSRLSGKTSYSTFPSKEIQRMAGTILVTRTDT